MKLIRWIASIVIITGVTGCVAPFYGTARIEEGGHIDVGLAGTSYIPDALYLPASYFAGARADVELRYGINQYYQWNLRVGFIGGRQMMGHPTDTSPHEWDIAFSGSLGVQFALPNFFVDPITPAIRLEAGYDHGQFYPFPTLMVGFGNPEIITVGTRLYYYFPGELFVLGHIANRWNVFAGVNVYTFLHPDYWSLPPTASIGIGYKIK